MFFEKPNIKYVDMCIYIDDHIYTDNYSQELVYQYLYHIVMMIALRRGYFSTRNELEDFSLYSASFYYTRLTDERQFEENPPIDKVRSILNYIKKSLFTVKRDYCKKNASEYAINDMDIISIDSDSFSSFTSHKIDHLDKLTFEMCLGDAQDFIKEYLNDIPYEKGSTVWTNIYISCLLSFLNSITLRNKDIKRIQNFKRPNSYNDTLLSKLYTKERYSSTILYHLDDSMYNYITVLTNRIRHKLSAELSYSLHTYTNSYTTMKNLLMSNVLEDKDY